MRFLHTADWQIGMRAAHLGSSGARARQARLDSARAVMALPGADFVLVAGDTFEDNNVDRALVEEVGGILAAFPGPVFLLPGNHDPLVPGSVWHHPVWSRHANLRIIDQPGAYPVPGGTLLAAPLRARHSKLDPTLWLATAERPAGITLAMSHGSVRDVDPGTEHYPIPADAWRPAVVDYLALGHWHSTLPFKDSAGAVRMAYCGTHETTKFGERDSGNALRIEIASPGAAPRVEIIPTGRLRWHAIEREIHHPGDLSRLITEILELPEESLVSVTLRGLLHASDIQELESLPDRLKRFLFASVATGELHPAAENGAWIDQLPPGVLQIAARTLLRRSSQGDRLAVAALLELQSAVLQAGA